MLNVGRVVEQAVLSRLLAVFIPKITVSTVVWVRAMNSVRGAFALHAIFLN